VGRRISFKVKLALRTLLAHPARSFVVFLGVFLGSLVMLWGLGMRDTMVHASTTSALELGSFEHEYLLNTFLDENPYGGDDLLVSSLEAPDGTSLLLVGAASDSIYLNLALVDGADAANATDAATAATAATAALEDGYYVTSLAAEAQGWQVGDRLTFYNPLTLEACELTVAGVINNNAQKAIFTSPELVEELTGLAATRFNALVSATALDIPSSLVAQEVKTQAIGEQINVMIEEMDAIVGLIVGLGMIVCVAAVCVAVDLLVAESRSNISMLKVLGYRDRSIDAMVLNAYHLLVPVGIVLAIPAARAITEWQMWVYVDYGVMFMKPTLTAASLAVTIALVVACYASSLLLLRRKVARVNMIEALKDQRE
jgi:putative ABC transport system permease protein